MGSGPEEGWGAVIMELSIAQKLDSIDQEPLLLVFMDLRKDYDTVDRDRLLITLKGYGSGPWMCGNLDNFWDCQQVMLRHNGFHGPAFPAKKGIPQGGLVSLPLFNVMVDNVIRTCLAMTVEDQRMEHDRIGETIRQCLEVLYADNIMVGSSDSDWQ